MIVTGECGADILIAPLGIIKVDNALCEYYSNIPLAHTHMLPFHALTNKTTIKFNSVAFILLRIHIHIITFEMLQSSCSN